MHQEEDDREDEREPDAHYHRELPEEEETTERKRGNGGGQRSKRDRSKSAPNSLRLCSPASTDCDACLQPGTRLHADFQTDHVDFVEDQHDCAHSAHQCHVLGVRRLPPSSEGEVMLTRKINLARVDAVC
eukprot:1803208-Rhodomonas_salina.2